MSNIKTFIRFFTISDYEEEEIWLREQHNNGWKLVKMIPPCFYRFEECTPEDVIYRLDYKNGSETRDYLQMLEDYEWEYVTRCTGWLYFRRPAAGADTPEEQELFSDNTSRLDMVQHIIRTRILPLVVIFCCCLFPAWIKNCFGDPSEASLFFAVFFSVMFVIYIYIFVHCGFKLKKLRRKYGDPA